MAEPFSVATGIAGLISLTIDISKITHAYVHNVRNASKKASELDHTLAALTQVLEQLELLLKKEIAGVPTFRQTSVLFLNYDRCKATLQEVRSKFDSSFRRSMETLIWPFREKKHQKAVADIHLWMQIFYYALDVEAW